MRVDVSEIKSFRMCRKNWEYSSRNTMHLRPKAINENFFVGTMIHEALHSLYLGGNVDKIRENALKEFAESEKSTRSMLTNIINNYAADVLPDDLERYEVKDIEYKFEVPFDEILSDACITSEDLEEIGIPADTNWHDIFYCGSIDMVVIEKATKKVFGFEHKTTKAYRPDMYVLLDEQPRMYFEILHRIVKEMGPEYSVGGIYLNQIKKTVRELQYKRVLCRYYFKDRKKFLIGIARSLYAIRANKDCAQEPTPGYMSCQMCDYSTLCQEYGYAEVSREDILEEFSEEFEVRDVDHLEEKVERNAVQVPCVYVRVRFVLNSYDAEYGDEWALSSREYTYGYQGAGGASDLSEGMIAYTPDDKKVMISAVDVPLNLPEGVALKYITLEPKNE